MTRKRDPNIILRIQIIDLVIEGKITFLVHHIQFKGGVYLFNSSPYYLLYYGELITGRPMNDGNSILTDFRIMKMKGICSDELFPNITKTTPNPIEIHLADLDAYKHRESFYQRILTLEDAFYNLSNHNPIAISFLTFPSMKNAASSGVVTMPYIDEKSDSEHTAVIIDYEKDQGYVYPDGRTTLGFFEFQNSYGDDWGNQGFGYLPFEYVEKYHTEMLCGASHPILLRYPTFKKITIKSAECCVHTFITEGLTISHQIIKVFELYYNSRIVSYIIVSITGNEIELIDLFTWPEYVYLGFDDFLLDYWLSSEKKLGNRRIFGRLSRDDFTDGWEIIIKKYKTRGFTCTADNKYPWSRCFIEIDL